MFCFKCGKQLSDDSLFCQYCGAKQSSTIKQSDGNGELDREAMRIYLGNVLSLECIKNKYERQIAESEFRIEQIKNRNYYKKYPLEIGNRATKPYVHFWFDGTYYYLAETTSFRPCLESHLYADYKWVFLQNKSDLEITKTRSYWEPSINLFFYSDGFFERRKKAEKARDGFCQAFASFKTEAPTAYQDNINQINKLEQRLNGIQQELSDVNQLLKKAYDINLIPEPFRYKLYAIYYLHNFVTTSRESFTTALFHFDLDEIKAKLDKIIEQQETIVIQNAVMIAQNDMLAKQNQQQLEHLSRIESDVNQAAQYAQIAANNAETCAWISMANYIEVRR